MGSGGKQRQTTTSTTTPNVPSWIQTPYQTLIGQVGETINKDPSTYTVGANANQLAGWGSAGGAGGSSWMQNGLTGFQNIADGGQDVNYDSLAEADLTPYMNPFTRSVIDTSLADLNRTTDRNIAENQSRATASGAYGGSRHGVADSLTYGEGAREAGLLSSGLNLANFNQARQGAMYDIGNRYTAGVDNRGARAAALAGLLSGGAALDANSRANSDQLMQAGAEERDVALQNNPELARLKLALIQSGLLSNAGALFSGSTTNGTSTSSRSPGLLDVLSLGSSLFGAFGGSMGFGGDAPKTGGTK